MNTINPSKNTSAPPGIQLVAAMLSAFALTFAGHAQTVPSLVNYQGRLSNPDGSPLPTADYTLTFNVFDAVTNGTLVWGPLIFDITNGVPAAGHGLKIPVVQGYFNVMLGPVDTTNHDIASAFTNWPRYVEIKVGTNNPIAPRQQILSAPYALNSAKLAGYDWTVILAGGSNNPATGKILGSKIEPGGITSSQINTNVVVSRTVATNVPVAPVGSIAISDSCGYFQSLLSSIPTLITNFGMTIATQGNPVEVSFTPSSNDSLIDTNNPAAFTQDSDTNSGPSITLFLRRNGVIIQAQTSYVNNGTSGGGSHWPNLASFAPNTFRFLDYTAPSGTNRYEVLIQNTVMGQVNRIHVAYMRMVVREL